MVPRVFDLTIVHYDTSAMKRFLTSVTLQHEPKASDVITLVKKTFFRMSIVRNFISRGVKMRISAQNNTQYSFYLYNFTQLSSAEFHLCIFQENDRKTFT